MSTLTHYADKPRTLDRGRTYKQLPPESFTLKPRGLWVSVDGEDDWHSWCTGELFHLDGLTHAYRVMLTDDANVLWITDRWEFIEFHQTYAMPEQRSRAWRSMNDNAIDWPAVAFKYDGIIIAPYQWEFRFSHMWYYGVDCASGCIWNLSAIESFNPITHEEVEKSRARAMEENRRKQR